MNAQRVAAKLMLVAGLCALACRTAGAPKPKAAAAAVSAPADAAQVAGELPGEQVLDQAPELGALPAFAAPVPQLMELRNGLRVYLLERPGDGIESVMWVSQRGAVDDPTDLPGVASLTAEVMNAGAAGRTQAQMARAADAIGATLSASAGRDDFAVHGSAMAGEVERLVPLLADWSLRPNFEMSEWTKIRAQRRSELTAQLAEPTVAAERAFEAAIYGGGPLGRPIAGTRDSLQRIGLANLRRFYAGIGLCNTALVAVGGAKPERVLAALERSFGAWKPSGVCAPPAALGAPPPSQRPALVLVEFPNRPQSVVRVGLPAVPQSSPDRLALELLNSVLGGSFTSRLNQNLREKHGYTYGARSQFEFGRGPGPFVASASVKTDTTGESVREMLSEIDRVAREPLTSAELDKGRALLAFRLAQQLSRADSATQLVADQFLYALPSDEYRTLLSRLRALTPQEVQAAAVRVLRNGGLTVTIAGEGARSLALLKAAGVSLADPEWRDAAGQRLAETPSGSAEKPAKPAQPGAPDRPAAAGAAVR